MEDYEKILDSVFENANSDEIGCFLRNEEVPFEYCMKALKRGSIGWENKLLIAKRRDCPEKIVVKMCKGAGEKFSSDLLSRGCGIPHDALVEIMKKDINFESIMRYWDLPDDLRRIVFEKLVNRQTYYSSYSSPVLDFIGWQCSIPNDCWKYFEDAVEDLKKKQNERQYYYSDVHRTLANASKCLDLMISPINENLALAVIDEYHDSMRHSTFDLMKVASNPSISDYVVLQMRMKIHDKDALMLLDRNEGNREEYRKTHKVK